MRSRIGIGLVVALVALAAVAAGLADTSYATGEEVMVVSNAALAGTAGGSFATHTYPLQACKEYTLRMNYNTVPSGTPTENTLGFQVWNNHGDANLTSAPYGQRKWEGTSQRYYLESIRRTDVPSIEEIKFKVDCADTNPSYTFRTFNFEPNGTLNYTLSLPAGSEN